MTFLLPPGIKGLRLGSSYLSWIYQGTKVNQSYSSTEEIIFRVTGEYNEWYFVKRRDAPCNLRQLSEFQIFLLEVNIMVAKICRDNRKEITKHSQSNFSFDFLQNIIILGLLNFIIFERKTLKKICCFH